MLLRKNKESLPKFYNVKDIVGEDSRFTQTSTTFELMENALKNEVKQEKNLNLRMVKNDYAVPILESIDNMVCAYDNGFFAPPKSDVIMRKNAQACLKILFDFTNLQTSAST